jgi:hypothetical protein
MSQSFRNSADKLAEEMAKSVDLDTLVAVDLDTLVGGLEIVISLSPEMLVMALATMDANTTKQMIVLAMTMVIAAKLDQSNQVA